ncbi:uncharacterized protein JCM6883_002557 [Sporobolomyces salmoneus]|uniref:uncharacterized protein n=1 Tax=Sporobolomyces salmoneus TaxID=183962 RepID=UPI00317D708A
MDFAYPGVLSRPQTPSVSEPTSPQSRTRSLKSLASPRKTGHYRHHEAGPRKLIRKLNSLLHGNLHRGQRSRNGSLSGSRSPFGGSTASLSRGNSMISSSSALSRTPLSAEPEPITPELSIEDQRPCIKVRLATFNMHDTLPTSDADFSDWLGDVSSASNRPPSKKRKRSSMSSRNSTMTLPMDKELPKFALDDQNYHIIVVASQECPTASGVLAGRVRTLDGRGWTNMLENYLCGGSCYDSESESSSSESEGDQGRNTIRRAEGIGSRQESVERDRSSLSVDTPRREGDNYNSDSGSVIQSQSATDNDDISASRTPSLHGSSSGDSRRRRGPYVLVEKERLMGIYIAVFVARGCQDLVEGVSKSRVPAGLIGGRLGNKGGVAVSLHFANSRLLFVSAHLAAHASAIEIRKQNVIKILSEITVDDFWEASGRLGPKPKNVTDRFDQTFFMGDLNFRLNVTRLHSDWLIARKDYSTALRFDQLRDVLIEKASVFPGFAEGPISFAPTYKYDVVHRVKKKRSTILGGRSKRGSREGVRGSKVPFPLQDSAAEDESAASMSDPEVVSSRSAKPGDEDDTLSVISSVGTISTLDDFEQLEREELHKGDLSSLGLPTPPKKGAETQMDAVRSAQVRFLTLVKSNSAALQYARKRSSSTAPKSAPPLKTMFNPPLGPRPILKASQSALVVPMTRSTSVPLGVGESALITDVDQEEPTTDSEGKKGLLRNLKMKAESIVPVVEPVFDSSSKQRVQSYTDRILFKTTIEPPPGDEEEEEEEEERPVGEPSLHPSRSSAFVSALRDLTHVAPLTSTLRPRSAEGDVDQTIRARRGSAEDRHLRFSDVFTRPRRSSVSSDSDRGGDIKHSMPRTKSLQPGQLRRQHSGANSVGTDETESNRKKAFWRRVASFPALNSMSTSASTSASAPSSPKLSSTPSKSSPVIASTSPVVTPTTTTSLREPSYFADINPASSNTSASVPTTPTTPTRRTPRKIFTLSSNSPPSSPEEPRPTVNFVPPPQAIETPPLLPRANSEQTVPTTSSTSSSHFHFPRIPSTSGARRPVRSVSGSALPTSTASSSPVESPSPIDPVPHVQTSTASLNTRFKSFLNSIPLPFLSAPVSTRSLSAASTTHSAKIPRKKKKHGPRCGEIQVLKYDSVRDLAKMGAVSDHRPVFLSCAIGVGDPKPDEDKDDSNLLS